MALFGYYFERVESQSVVNVNELQADCPLRKLGLNVIMIRKDHRLNTCAYELSAEIDYASGLAHAGKANNHQMRITSDLYVPTYRHFSNGRMTQQECGYSIMWLLISL